MSQKLSRSQGIDTDTDVFTDVDSDDDDDILSCVITSPVGVTMCICCSLYSNNFPVTLHMHISPVRHYGAKTI